MIPAIEGPTIRWDLHIEYTFGCTFHPDGPADVQEKGGREDWWWTSQQLMVIRYPDVAKQLSLPHPYGIVQRISRAQ
jgi:hypothetical protein